MFFQFLFVITVFSGVTRALPAKDDGKVEQRFFEGDIAGMPEKNISKKLTTGGPWPSGTVPYTISKGFGELASGAILDAIALLNETCVKFVPHSAEKDFVQIEPSNQSFSYVGRTGGGQTVGLKNDDSLIKGTVLHQLMHVLGFYHEHTRLDRDNYIDINWSNIAEANKLDFQKYVDPSVFGQPYDFGSIMHYGETIFGTDKTVWTMRPNTEWNIVRIGQSEGLSEVDKRKINLLYNCTDTEVDVHSDESASRLLNSTSTIEPDLAAKPETNSAFHVDSDPDVQNSSSIYVLKPGENLHINETIWSRSKNIRMTLQESGNLVIFIADDCGAQDRAIWASVVYHYIGAFGSKKGPAMAQLQPDGNFVINNLNDSTVRWSSKTNGSYFSGASLKLNDDGKMVIYKDGKALWQSGGHTFCLPLSASPFHETQVLLKSGEQLRPGQTITSTNGKTRLEFKSTGDLTVIRTCDGSVHWSSQTDGMPVSILKMQTDGNLVIYNDIPAPVWASASNEDSCKGCADLRLSGGTLCTYRRGSCTWTSSSMEEDCPWNLDEANVAKKPF